MGSSDGFCDCGRRSYGKCTRCGLIVCEQHCTEVEGRLVCLACETAAKQAIVVAKDDVLGSLTGLDQVIAGLRQAATANNLEGEYRRLKTLGLPFVKPTLLEEIQPLSERYPPKFRPAEVWSDFNFRKAHFGRTPYRQHVELVTTLDASLLSLHEGDGTTTLDLAVFSNGAILRLPEYHSPYRHEDWCQQRFPMFRFERPERRVVTLTPDRAGMAYWRKNPQAGVDAIRKEFERFAQRALPGAIELDVLDYSHSPYINVLPEAILDAWLSADWTPLHKSERAGCHGHPFLPVGP